MQCVGGKNSPIHCIPDQNPIQDAMENSIKATFFKLTLPNKGNKLKMAIWVPGTPQQFVPHICTMIHACKKMGLDANFAKVKVALKYVNLHLDISKMEYSSKAKEYKEMGEK